jgi:hypothetical protein
VNGAWSALRERRRHSARPDVYLFACALLSAMLVPGAGLAQTARPTVSVTATIPAEPASQTPLVIRVGPPEAVPRGSFIRVRGLPPMGALSEGYSIAPGSWAVPLAALPKLKITLPVTAVGKSEISITLVAIDGTVLGRARSIIIVAAPSPARVTPPSKAGAQPLSILRAGSPVPAAPDGSKSPPAAAPAPVASKLTGAQRERALRLLKKGDEELAEGGIAQARVLYERAAEAGLSEGAMALAATYDAAELSRLGVLGLRPDPAAAKRWYERAQQLGATDAEQRLRRLGAN